MLTPRQNHRSLSGVTDDSATGRDSMAVPGLPGKLVQQFRRQDVGRESSRSGQRQNAAVTPPEKSLAAPMGALEYTWPARVWPRDVLTFPPLHELLDVGPLGKARTLSKEAPCS